MLQKMHTHVEVCHALLVKPRQTAQVLVLTMKVGKFQSAAPMKGRLRPRLRAARSNVGKKDIRQYTVFFFSQRLSINLCGGFKLKLRRLAQHADREPEEDDIMAPAI